MNAPIDMRGVRGILELNSEVKTLREKEFVEKWLLTMYDYCRGVPGIQIGIWLQEMDITPYQEVGIIGAEGTEIYRVPALMLSDTPLFSKTILEELPNIAYKSELMEKTIPGAGAAYIRDNLIPEVRAQEGANEVRRRWDEIFVRYGFDPVYSVSKQAMEQAKRDEDVFEEYDDL